MIYDMLFYVVLCYVMLHYVTFCSVLFCSILFYSVIFKHWIADFDNKNKKEAFDKDRRSYNLIF